MIELKHTPGPWALDGWAIQSVIAQTKDSRFRNGIGYVTVFTVADSQREIPLEERVANARLIAAAPDLLRELITFHEFLINDDFHKCENFCGGCPIRAAIDKATGATR